LPSRFDLLELLLRLRTSILCLLDLSAQRGMFTPRNINSCLLFADLCDPGLEFLLLAFDLVAESLSFIYRRMMRSELHHRGTKRTFESLLNFLEFFLFFLQGDLKPFEFLLRFFECLAMVPLSVDCFRLGAIAL
jgi:hypothetical protein